MTPSVFFVSLVFEKFLALYDPELFKNQAQHQKIGVIPFVFWSVQNKLSAHLPVLWLLVSPIE
jgi:hypothetical protein